MTITVGQRVKHAIDDVQRGALELAMEHGCIAIGITSKAILWRSAFFIFLKERFRMTCNKQSPAASNKNLTGGSTRTPTLAMASPFYWPVLVPFSRCAPYGAG